MTEIERVTSARAGFPAPVLATSFELYGVATPVCGDTLAKLRAPEPPLTQQRVIEKYDLHIEAMFVELERLRPSTQPPSEIGKMLAKCNWDLESEWRVWWTTDEDSVWS